MKALFALVLATIVLCTLLVVERHRVLLWSLGSEGPPPLLAPGEEGAAVRWHDDYYFVEALAPGVFAIGEPRYEQQNLNYLIIGEQRALLFDAGSGLRDIRPVVRALTNRPLTFVPSHFHYDHIGNEIVFERVAVVDLPQLRARAADNRMQLRWQEHLGAPEGYAAPVLTISDWLAPGSWIDLGGRQLQVLHTPGHTEESISLFEPQAQLLFAGDFLYQGPLYAFLPNSSLRDYTSGARTVLDTVPETTTIFGAHREGPPGTPRQTIADVEDLRRVLGQIRTGELDGEGIYPVAYRINKNIVLLAEPAWLQDW